MNLYHKLLNLPESEAPPDHYGLLGVSRFTDDTKQIHAALVNRNKQLRAWDNSKLYREANALLDEVVAAGMILEDPIRKAVYDAELRQRLGLSEPQPVSVVTPIKIVDEPRWADSFDEWNLDEPVPELPPVRPKKSATDRPDRRTGANRGEAGHARMNLNAIKVLFLTLGVGLIVVSLLIMSVRSLRSSQWKNSVGMSFKTLPGFSIGITEVTQSQYLDVVGTNPSLRKGLNNPVDSVSWDDAVAFCERLSALPAERAAGRVYRLPTEAEWEFACRAGTTTDYSFGDAPSDLGEYAWFFGNSRGSTHAVATKRANPWGLYDMHGNVSEWCGDEVDLYRVCRGACWNSSAEHCSSAFRDKDKPSSRRISYGFRLAMSSPQSPEQAEAARLARVARLAAAKAEAARIATEKPWKNSVGMSFKTLSKFSMGITEVTQSQYEDVVGTNPSNSKGPNNPVEQVSWDDAVAFCVRLSALPAERAAGRVYRLPTDAEWVFACRAGTTTKYSFGDSESDLGAYAWFAGNSGRTTHAVRTKLANPWGLYDMHGNVSEWCQDKEGSYRVIRGGCWHDFAEFCQTLNRNAYEPSARNTVFGFRLALSSPSVQSPEAEQSR